jgi:hypothetical protein
MSAAPSNRDAHLDHRARLTFDYNRKRGDRGVRGLLRSCRRDVMGTRSIALLILACAQAAFANDFPTRARVEFVLNCMRETKAPQQESMYKCSCAIDKIADKVDYSTWVDLSTVANGTTIAGERGGIMRDLKDGRKMIASYRELQEGAKKSCFIQ